MDIDHILRAIALVGAIIVAVVVLAALRAEWKKTELDDHVTKVMMILLTLGCIEAALVALGVWGRT